GTTLATATGHTVRLWDTTTGRERWSPPGHRGPISFLAMSADGSLLLSADHATVALWDVRSGRLLRQAGDEREPVRPLGREPDRKSLKPGGTRLWVRGRQQPSTPARARSPDGWLEALAGPDGTVRLRDAATGAELHRFVGHRERVTALTFLGGRLLASGSA